MAPCDVDGLLALSRERFGISAFHPLQRLAIANVLEAEGARPSSIEEGGEDVVESQPTNQVVILPTGAGKSLCFQAPALVLAKPTLVLYPLLALMEDQRRRLDQAGIETAIFRGGQSPGERRASLEALRGGRAKIAIANPEVLASPALRAELAAIGIAHLAIDEAHCVSEWGESFRPAYLGIRDIIEALRPEATSAFTATASPAVLESVTGHLFKKEAWRLISGNPDRPNIHWSVVPTLSRSRSLFRLLEVERRPLIVFASSRKAVERIAAAIRSRRRELDLRYYHAGLDAPEKRAIEAWFLASEDGLLVATCAYGMGVDKKDIRTVIHWELPESVEAYLQEAGRGGRDGESARAILILGHDEGGRERSGRDSGRLARRQALFVWASEGAGCRRRGLLGLLGAAMEGPCRGCDRCEGRAVEEREGESIIEGFVRLHRRRFDRAATAERLGAAPLFCGLADGREAFPLPLAGGLADWEPSEISTAIGAMIELARIRERPRRPWKGRLELAGTGRSVFGLLSRGRLSALPRHGPGRWLVPARRTLRNDTHETEEGPDDENRGRGGQDAPVGEDLDR
ncbi:MAG TPA: RecQ family ATP-dependent DNA helicase [Rectinemataceae bacterium]|nr:RecQ family ATP-dependent DNA helicase [Rectinemataceae bacterium]